MELLTPGIGLIFWMTLSFGLVLMILRKYAWRPILSAIKARERSIVRSLVNARRIEEEMLQVDIQKEKILKEAERLYHERLEKADQEAEELMVASRLKATNEARRILDEAGNVVEAQKKLAMMEIREHIATLSFDIAEKVLEEEFHDKERNTRYVGKLLDEMILN